MPAQLTARGDVATVVRAARVGDQAAWNELVDRFGSLVWAVCRSHRLGREEAADVSQIVWMRLLTHLPTLRQPERVGAWLATTTRNECLHSCAARSGSC